MKVMASLVDHYLQEMAESIRKAERSEETYLAVVERYHEKFGPGILADQRAASHPDLQQAIGDGAFYRSRATMYAAAAVAAMLDLRRVKP